MKYNFKFEGTKNLKQKPNDADLQFGVEFTDHMFIMEYEEGKGWYDGRIVPYAPLQLDPASSNLHYGQEMFEGLKSYKSVHGDVLLFRPDMNAKRTNNTNNRLCIPEIDEDLFVAAIKALVDVDSDWIPGKQGTSLYIRPFIIATEPYLGVRASKTYKFIIILSPVGSYYKDGLKPTKLWVEDFYVRATKGGTGEAKCAGNYAAALKAQEIAHEKGYEQVLWLDSIERKYIEEVGTSNAFFVIGDEVITAPLDGTILPGITRDSVITYLRDNDVIVKEKKLSMDELVNAYESGELKEMFATGTAAIISPVGELNYKDRVMIINNNKIGGIAKDLYDTIYGIQTGQLDDVYNWTVKVK
ncbi:MAG: branched-chain amino acid aminotransferase [Clostridiales bacterium]|nr:branched-chain amino acid aminotransferase [Clostridiales bacterium]